MFSKSAQKKLSKWVTPRAVLKTPGASTSSSLDPNLYVGGYAVAKHSSVFASLGGVKIVAIHKNGLGLTEGPHYEVKGGLTFEFRKIPGRVVKPTISPAPNRTFFVMESDIVSTRTINARYAAKQKSLAEKKNRKVHFPSPPVTNEYGANDTPLPSESAGSAPSSQGSPPGDDWGTPSPENNPNNCIQVFRRKKEPLYRADQDVVPPAAGMTYVGETDSETESEISDDSDDDSDDSDDSDAPATPVRRKRKRGVVLFDPEAPLPPILFRKRKRKSAERLTVKTFRGKDNLKPEPTVHQ